MDFDDERVRLLLKEELDRREKEKQDACNHRRAGTIIKGEMRCDDCAKFLDDNDLANAYCDGDNVMSGAVKKVKVIKDANL